jgi:hypothetical protein
MRELIKKLLKGWHTYVLWGAVLTLIIIPLLISFTYMALTEGAANKKYVTELRKIADATPLYPGFQKAGEKVVLKRDMVSFNTWYKSQARFADVKAFYARELPSQGWSPPKPPPSSIIEFDAHVRSFRRGDYFIELEQNDRQSDGFSIVFIWDPQ